MAMSQPLLTLTGRIFRFSTVFLALALLQLQVSMTFLVLDLNKVKVKDGQESDYEAVLRIKPIHGHGHGHHLNSKRSQEIDPGVVVVNSPSSANNSRIVHRNRNVPIAIAKAKLMRPRSKVSKRKRTRKRPHRVQLSKKGAPCLSACRTSGKSYNWCYLSQDKGDKNKHSWEYCTPLRMQRPRLEALATDGIVSSHGIPCKSKCEPGKGTKHHCTTIRSWGTYPSRHTWDHCSPIPGTDYRLKKCSSPCGYYGHSYKWCHLRDGGWGYCSRGKSKRFKSSKKSTSYGNKCRTKCGKTDGTSYNWCRTTAKYNGWGWDYCSAKDGHDYKDVRCADSCLFRGYKYAWCKRVGGSWGYCSPKNK